MDNNYIPIIDNNDKHYTMFVSTHKMYDVESQALCIEGDVRDFDLYEFSTLEIENRFGSFVNDSVLCSISHIESILAFVIENEQLVRQLLPASFDKSMRDPIRIAKQGFTKFDLDNYDKKPILCSDVPNVSFSTKNKRFFILTKDNTFDEVSLRTAMEIVGDQCVYGHCRQLEFLNGIGYNGRMFWADGLGIQDITRDGYRVGNCG